MALSSSRKGTRVIWVTVHTAEGIRKASDLKAFFDRSQNSSAHAVADDTTLLDNLVPYGNAAWTLRNGNAKSDNLELCGFASWSRAEWTNNHQGMLRNAAAWIRSRCQARGIPMVKLSPADVRAGKSGVIGHVDYSQGTGDGTHWDPGPAFPWDVVMAMARGAVNDSMDVNNPHDAALIFRVFDFLQANDKRTQGAGAPEALPMVTNLKALMGRVEALVNHQEKVTYGPTAGQPNKLYSKVESLGSSVQSLSAGVTELSAKVNAPVPVEVDYDLLADKVADRLAAVRFEHKAD